MLLPMRRMFALILGLALPLPAAACDLALVLAVDVSGSVGDDEYRIQMRGIAAALRDGEVSEALVRGQAALLLLQWSSVSRQEIVLPWRQVADFDDIEALAQRIETAPRAWRDFDTALGQALDVSRQQFDGAPACRRRVIDLSGDGKSNEGIEPAASRAGLTAAGITVNGLAIEARVGDLGAYFRANVIAGGDAFVATAADFTDFPAAMRRKLRRETARQIVCAEACDGAPG
jgi:Ca-activated chloride channel family protein